MVKFTALLEKLGAAGDKTGWTCVFLPAEIAAKLKPGNKREFRVKGSIDAHELKFTAVMPAGNGRFILPVNATVRKAIRKIHGATVELMLAADDSAFVLTEELVECLADDPAASAYFYALKPSEQHWFSNWISGAKTIPTKTKRLTAVIKACALKMEFGEMMRMYRDEKNLIR